MLIHWIWLSRLSGITSQQKQNLLLKFRDAEDIYFAHEEALAQVEGMTPKAVEVLCDKDLRNAKGILSDCGEKGISILTYGDGAYPTRLKNIHNPPLVLYYKGCLPDWDSKPVIGMVGTRKASAYGLQVAEKLGNQIAGCGALVVSGGADGIDTRALVGAMETGSKVVAVLGCGADVVYPAKNRELFRRIEKQGCLITEYIPGTPAHGWNFPPRNRIISGLSAGVVIVEAPERSGALSTANHASEQGRDVYVVPGNINNPNCAGSNQLLREYAMAVFTGWDVVKEYAGLYPDAVRRYDGSEGYARVAQKPERPQPKPTPRLKADKKSIDIPGNSQYSVEENKSISLTAEEKAVLGFVPAQPTAVDEVIAASGLPAGKVLSILTMLAMKGMVQNHPGKCISLK